MKDAGEQRNIELRDDRRRPTVTPTRSGPPGLLALQRQAGNAAVARALQRAGGWTGRDIGARSPNAAEQTVTDKPSGKSARRIPIQGIPQGNVKDDSADVMNSTPSKDDPKVSIDHPVSERTAESSAGGRAIVVIPADMRFEKDTSVDVLLHLHGHTTGYRQERGDKPRDLGVEKIEEQVASATHPLIAVLPQGGFHSWFGKSGQSFDPTAYLDAVWGILTKLGVWSDPPKRSGLMLSSHSGGDAPIEDMLAKAEKSGSGEVADLKGLFLLDTMYGPTDATHVIDFMRFRLARDLAQIATLKTEKEQIDWVHANGFRLVGEHSGGHYKPQMKQVADAIVAWFAEADTIKVLGQPGSPVSAAVATNLAVDTAAAGGEHLTFVGDKGHLRRAIDTLPGP